MKDIDMPPLAERIVPDIDAARAHGWTGVRIDPSRDTAGQIETAVTTLGVLTPG